MKRGKVVFFNSDNIYFLKYEFTGPYDQAFWCKDTQVYFLTVWAGNILAQSCSLNKPVGEPPDDTTMYKHFSFRQDILMFPYIGLCYKLKILLGWCQF